MDIPCPSIHDMYCRETPIALTRVVLSFQMNLRFEGGERSTGWSSAIKPAADDSRGHTSPPLMVEWSSFSAALSDFDGTWSLCRSRWFRLGSPTCSMCTGSITVVPMSRSHETTVSRGLSPLYIS